MKKEQPQLRQQENSKQAEQNLLELLAEEKFAQEHSAVHAHIHANQKQVLNRLARIEGHVHAVRRMVEEGRDCPEVLIQIAAVRKALDNTAKLILKDHLEHCVLHAIAEGKGSKSLEEFELAIDRYLK